ncbi:MAG: arginine--tRNA ligase domain-containing protein [Candidatus Kariarchaeaceae archaeon]
MFENFHKPIAEILEENGITSTFQLLKPPSPELGDFCIVVNRIAGKEDPLKLGESLKQDLIQIKGIEKIELYNTKSKKKTGIVYLNFLVTHEEKSRLQIEFIEISIKHIFSNNFGRLSENKGKTAIVEHTSANPISPLHVGNLRNSIQGDTFARILERTGYKVYRHFYVNDVGLQVSFVVIGYEIMKKRNIKPAIKVDHWLGQLYAIMNVFYSIQTLKKDANIDNLSIGPYSFTTDDCSILSEAIVKEIETFEIKFQELDRISRPTKEEKREHTELKRKISKKVSEVKKIEQLFATNINLKERFLDSYTVLLDEVNEIDLHTKTSKYLLAYENNSTKRITTLFREVVEWILKAFQWTLKRYNVEFDQFDFESDVTKSGLPDEIIEKLAISRNALPSKGKAVRYTYPSEEIDRLVKSVGITKKELPIKGKVPDLQLRRSDGTKLYAVKDIAYSIKKYDMRKPDIIYNVISTEQTLPQFQLLLPILELGMSNLAKILKHYSYELVDLRGRLMSGRLASYVTADEFYDETIIRARIAKRSADQQRGFQLPTNETEWKQESKMLQAVTLASTRFPLIETSPNRKIELDLDRELDLRRNSGPFVQYAHARASSIIRKVDIEMQLIVDFSLLVSEDAIKILDHLCHLNQQILNACNAQDPSLIAHWVFELAQKFMKYYEKNSVLHAESKNLMLARLTMVSAIKKGLSTGLNILGIFPAEQI